MSRPVEIRLSENVDKPGGASVRFGDTELVESARIAKITVIARPGYYTTAYVELLPAELSADAALVKISDSDLEILCAMNGRMLGPSVTVEKEPQP